MRALGRDGRWRLTDPVNDQLLIDLGIPIIINQNGRKRTALLPLPTMSEHSGHSGGGNDRGGYSGVRGGYGDDRGGRGGRREERGSGYRGATMNTGQPWR